MGADHIATLASQGIDQLLEILRTSPPAGVSGADVQALISRNRPALERQFAQLLISKYPIYSTPKTRVRWQTLREWLRSYKRLDARAPSMARNVALKAHLRVLPDSVVALASMADLAEFRNLLFRLRPPRGQRAGTDYERLVQAADRAGLNQK